MTSPYYLQLDELSKKRYLEKLMFKTELLPDPLDEELNNRLCLFKDDITRWPHITFGDIYIYLVEKECVYTKEKFKNFKAIEAYKYFDSGKVHQILVYKNQTLQISVIVGKVESSQRLKVFHTPWVVVHVSGEIESAHCTCMAGLGEVCSHVAAVLFTVEGAIKNNLHLPVSTSEPCRWNITKKSVQCAPTHEIEFFTKDVSNNETLFSSLANSVCYKAFLTDLKTANPNADIFIYLESDSEKTLTASETENEIEEIENPHECFHVIAPFPQFCKQIFANLSIQLSTISKSTLQEYFKISAHDAEQIERKSVDQHESNTWIKQREGRLTASNFGRILRSKGASQSLLMDILCLSNFTGCESTSWGRTHEFTAKNQFIACEGPKHENLDIFKCGLYVDTSASFLAASPDGIVSCLCCEKAIIEIKCPFAFRNSFLEEVKKKDFYLDENLHLKKNHPYFYQIQGQMGITQIKKCYFVNYTVKRLYIQLINFDEAMWIEMKYKLENFFYSHLLKEILEDSLKNNVNKAKEDCICKGSKVGVIIECNRCKKCFHQKCVSYRKKVNNWICQMCSNNK